MEKKMPTFALNTMRKFVQAWMKTFVQSVLTVYAQSWQLANTNVARGSTPSVTVLQSVPAMSDYIVTPRWPTNVCESLAFAPPSIDCSLRNSPGSISPSTLCEAVETPTGTAGLSDLPPSTVVLRSPSAAGI